eukprot:TRINITY_DN20632_c0_g2_i1.p1 TRINITY_DN20632_c0_g2~~TRINITY_DN20632_c0_g2_i1.p1  ORF type:complete len:462 (+),score=93.45 TRINITY_DN20632_c0_g2_i1:150-1535(+)
MRISTKAAWSARARPSASGSIGLDGKDGGCDAVGSSRGLSASPLSALLPQARSRCVTPTPSCASGRYGVGGAGRQSTCPEPSVTAVGKREGKSTERKGAFRLLCERAGQDSRFKRFLSSRQQCERALRWGLRDSPRAEELRAAETTVDAGIGSGEFRVARDEAFVRLVDAEVNEVLRPPPVPSTRSASPVPIPPGLPVATTSASPPTKSQTVRGVDPAPPRPPIAATRVPPPTDSPTMFLVDDTAAVSPCGGNAKDSSSMGGANAVAATLTESRTKCCSVAAVAPFTSVAGFVDDAEKPFRSQLHAPRSRRLRLPLEAVGMLAATAAAESPHESRAPPQAASAAGFVVDSPVDGSRRANELVVTDVEDTSLHDPEDLGSLLRQSRKIRTSPARVFTAVFTDEVEEILNAVPECQDYIVALVKEHLEENGEVELVFQPAPSATLEVKLLHPNGTHASLSASW